MIVKDLLESLKNANADALVVVATESWPDPRNIELDLLESVEVGKAFEGAPCIILHTPTNLYM